MDIHIPRDRLDVRFSRSGGPGGQNVNKVETQVEVRFRIDDAGWIPAAVRKRLVTLFPSHVNRRGEFCVNSSRYRSQGRNLDDCLAKLQSFLRRASARPKRRIATRPTQSSKERRLQSKERRGQTKRNRSWRSDE